MYRSMAIYDGKNKTMKPALWYLTAGAVVMLVQLS